MGKYVVKQGRHHGAMRQYGPGDVVELDEESAKLFADKLDPLLGEVTITSPDPQLAVQGDLVEALDANVVDLLLAGGFTSVAEVAAASDNQLLSLDGVGRVTLRLIREAIPATE